MNWFTSDHHFGHHNVIKYCDRPFATADEMNEDLVRRWNVVVKPEDTVWYLGDFSLSKSKLAQFLPRLNGTKHLVAGNHDDCHPVRCKSPEKQERLTQFYLANGFASVQLEKQMTIGGKNVLLHHLPFKGAGDHTGDERYTEIRPDDNGQWLLHGHVHQHWKQRERMINVGVDVWSFAPVSEGEIEMLLNATSPSKDDTE